MANEQIKKLSATERYHLKQFVKELAGYRGRHTELVTVYVPAGYQLDSIIGHLQQEQGTASNIKSKQTRTNVIDALERMIQHLKTVQRTPVNGLAAFAGNIAEKEGQSDLKVWSIEPPVPMKQRLYRCDKVFILEPLNELLDDESVYGLVVMDRRDAMIGLLKGKTIVPIRKTHSEVPGKTRAGGQSSVRFARLREGATKDHYKKIAEHMKEEFLFKEDLKGIILGGPGTTVNDFMSKEYVTADVRKKIIGTKDLSYTGEFGMQELLEKSGDLLAEEDVAEEKKIMQQFFHELSKDTRLAGYGNKEVREAIKLGAVDIVLVSEKLSDSEVEEFEELAKPLGTEVRIISVETREGVQLKEMGGVAAILRYPMTT